MPRKADASVSLNEVEAVNTHQQKVDKKRDERLGKELMYGTKAHRRTLTDTTIEKDTGYARLHNFGGGPSNVQMFWDFSDEGIKRQLFRLRIGTNEVVLSAVELQKYLRWV